MYQGALEAISNRQTWTEAFDCVDDDGEDVTITGATIVFVVRKKGCTSASLTATDSDGITIATPRFTVVFSVDDVSALDPGTYDVGCTVEIAGVTEQFIIGTINILDGIVP